MDEFEEDGHGRATYRYVTNSGSVLLFDVSSCKYFGFSAGDRVTMPGDRAGTIIGVRNGTLWVHIDGERGAVMVANKSLKELRRSGWDRFGGLAAALAAVNLPGAPTASGVTTPPPPAEEPKVALVVDHQRVMASRAKLMKNAFFRSMLTSGMKESGQSEIELKLDIRYDVFKLVVEYLEHGTPSAGSSSSSSPAPAPWITEENDLELLSAADMLQINGLRVDCFEFILKSIAATTPPERNADIMQAGMLYGLPQLEESVLYNLQHYGDGGALLAAIAKGYLDVAASVIQRLGPLWRQQRKLLQDEFLQSVARGFPPEFLRLLLDHSSNLKRTVNAADDKGNTALHILCSSDLAAAPMTADFLIGAGADGNVVNSQGATPLLVAALSNKPEMAKLLLMKGVSSSISDRAGNTPLHVAIERRHHAVSRTLLEDPAAPLNSKNCRGRCPLSALVVYGPSSLREMLSAWIGESPTKPREERRSGDSIPCTSPAPAASSPQVAASPAATTQPTATPPSKPAGTPRSARQGNAGMAALAKKSVERLLHWFAEMHCFNFVPVIVDSGIADLNSRDVQGDTLLHKAARDGSVSALRYLIGHGAQVDIVDRSGNTALHIAVLGRELEPVAELVHSGANVNAVNTRKNTPLHLLPLFVDEGQLSVSPAASRLASVLHGGSGQQPVPEKEQGTAISRSTSESGVEPLVHRRSRSDTTLWSQGDKPDAAAGVTTPRGAPIRRVSTKDDHVRIAQLLVSSGACTGAINSSRDSPVHVAARSRCAPLLRLLLTGEGAAAVYAPNSDSCTPLHLAISAPTSACSCGSQLEECVTLLVNAGSDVNQQDRHGDTCLHVAVARGVGEPIVRMLLEHGATRCIGNEAGETPLMVAHRTRDTAVCRLLEAEDCRVQ